MKVIKKAFFPLILISLLSSCDNNKMDPLEKWLIKNQYTYQIDSFGDYKISLTLDEKTQDIWIYGETYQAGDREIREIFTALKVDSELITPLLFEQLLIDNYQSSQMGYWALISENENKLILYQIKLPEEYLYDLLNSALLDSLETTGELQNHLSSLDIF